MLELTFNTLIVLEIIIAEFTSIWALSKKKHSFAVCVGIYAAITAALIMFMLFVAVKLPGYGDGNGRFMVLGIIYFIPVMVNYGGDWKNRFITAFYCFSYGLAIFALSVRIGYIFDEDYFNVAVFVAETVLYILTLPVFIRFSRERVITYIQKSTAYQKNILIRYTIASFLLIIFYNNIMVLGSSMIKKLLVYLLLIYFIVLTYRLLVSYLEADDSNQELSEMIKTDRLTQLGNLIALKEYLEAATSEGKPFCLIFMDLDNFKSINDTYGHEAGDLYLKRFARALRAYAGDDGACFRYAGDEFICATRDEGLYERLLHMKVSGENRFLGVSAGMAKYPDDASDASQLMNLADARMYEMKLDKPSARRKKSIKK